MASSKHTSPCPHEPPPSPFTPAMMTNLSCVEDEASLLLGAHAVDQEALERDIVAQADQALLEKENEIDRARLDRAVAKAKELQNVINERCSRPQRRGQALDDLIKKLDQCNGDISDIKDRINRRISQVAALRQPVYMPEASQKRPNETQKEFLIRTGKVTPFSNIPGLERNTSSALIASGISSDAHAQGATVQNLRTPGFLPEQEDEEELEDGEVVEKPPAKRRKVRSSVASTSDSDEVDEQDDECMPTASKAKTTRLKGPRKRPSPSTGSEFSESEDNLLIDAELTKGKGKRKRSTRRFEPSEPVRLDDGDEKSYQARLKKWAETRRKARCANRSGAGIPEELEDENDLEEWHLPHPQEPSTEFSGGFKLPGDVFPSLFDYQKTGVQWLWELHCQNAGGIIADEMGLGKTIQVIAFIAGLHHSGMLKKPCLIVAPGAVMKQWATEFHTWWPVLRVAILHSSGSGMLVDKEKEDYDESSDMGIRPEKETTKSKAAAKKIVERVFRQGHILITTYEGLTTYGGLLLDKEWEYAILDEGHRIRNPDALLSLTAKQLKTHHRIILSGTPIQNHLVELWSLFDFVFPGRLGALPVFKEQFEIPIRQGGYKNATNIQVQMSTQCAMVLRELCGPYLLRRVKKDVAQDLPKKTERVIFCKLTNVQREHYQRYIDSREVQKILDGNWDTNEKRSCNLLKGITILKHICNHPDLPDREVLLKRADYDYGKGEYSGKMQLTRQLLSFFKEGKNRVLLFCQGTQMLDIIEKDLKRSGKFTFRRMDGDTPIARRQPLVNEFNNDTSIDVFLLTTRVGGLGLNLVGADRVIIFDPDWNPSTDLQARERAWRIGQKKEVSIYRLVTAGTIEEKQYQRQVFKQHLANKILTDPQQRRFFQSDDLHDLFKLGSSAGGTETGSMFIGLERFYAGNGETATAAATPRTVQGEASALAGLEGVTRLQTYTGQENGQADDQQKEKDGEKQFIEMIFSGFSGVLSSVEHDDIVGATHHHEMSSSEKYANEVAQNARKAILESMETARAPIGTVTWTGKNGTAGLLPSGSSLLDAIRSRNSTRDSDPEGKKIFPRLRQWFRRKGGKATTEEIKEAGRELQVNIAKRPAFKKALNKLTNRDRTNHLFTLKSEFS